MNMIVRGNHQIGQDGTLEVLEVSRPFETVDRSAEQADVTAIQRVLEWCFALFVVIASAPLIAVLAVLIRLDSPGPVFFRHKRLGKGAQPFDFIKLRTFYADAKERWPESYAYQYTTSELDELFFKRPEDPRITPMGRWLRKSTFDELPNFWHVLTGDMNVIGPRPEIPEMLQYYKGAERRKFSVRPGISGLAQVSGRGRLNFRDTVRLDLEYVDNRSMKFDFKLFVKTTLSVLRLDGAF